MDLEMWMAAHDECGPAGCGTCTTLAYDAPVGDLELMRRAARLQRKPLDVFLAEVVMTHVGRL